MARIFISYAREDREAAAAIAQALQAAAHEVWWDRALVAGQDYTAVIEQQLNEADAVAVLWSASSVKSKFVRDEANHALQSGRLTPVRIEPVALPLGFASLHTVDVFSLDEDGRPALEPEVLVDEVARRLRAAAGGTRVVPPPIGSQPQRHQGRKPVPPWLWAAGAAVLATVGTAITLNWMDQPDVPVVRVALDAAASAPAASAVTTAASTPSTPDAVAAAAATAAVAAKAAAERERKLQAQREAQIRRKNDELQRQNELLRQEALEKERLAKEQQAAQAAQAAQEAKEREQAKRLEQERQAALEEQRRKEEQRLADARRKEEQAKAQQPPPATKPGTLVRPLDSKVLSQAVVKPSTSTLSATQRATLVNRSVIAPAASAAKP